MLDAVLSRAPVMVFALDAAGRCTFSDGAGLALIGLRPGQVVGVDMLEMYAGDPAAGDSIRRALAGESFRSAYVNAENRRAFDTWWLPVRHGEELTGAIGVSIDVTDRVVAEEERELYRAFVEAAPQFIALAGLDGAVQYVNPGGRRLAGIPPDVDVGSTTIADYLTAEGLAASVAVEQPAVIAHGAYEGETTLRHWPTDRGIPVRVSSFLVKDLVTGAPRALATVQSDITEVVQARQATEQTLAHQRGLLLHLHEAQEDERRRIAGALHDDTIQVLAAVNLRLHTVRRQLAGGASKLDVVTAIDNLDDAVRKATGRLRAALVDLDPPPVGDVGLERLITQHAQTAMQDSGAEWSVSVDTVAEPTDQVGRVLLRIAQEALTNVRKHSRATRVSVHVGQVDGQFTVRIADDGVGLTWRPDDGRHLGLRSMVDRAESVGGWCHVGVAPGGGTVVEARVPARLGHPDAGLAGPSHRLFLEQTMESISDAYCALDDQWRYVYMNSAGYRLLGRDPRDPVIGRVIWDEFEITPQFEEAYRRARTEQVPVQVTGYYAPWDKWIENRVLPTASGLSIFARDVTDEVRATEQARERGELIDAGRRVVVALAGAADLATALRAATEHLVRAWRLEGAVVRVPAGAARRAVEVVAGTVPGRLGHPRAVRALALGEREVGEIELVGDAGGVEDALLALFALRIAAES